MNLENQKMCPLKFLINRNGGGIYCSQEFCAWYNSYSQSCALVTISDVLSDSTINQIDWSKEREKQGENKE